MNSLKIREFRNAIISYVDGVDLPCEVKRLVLLEASAHVETKTQEELRNEITERNKQEVKEHAESVYKDCMGKLSEPEKCTQ